MTVYLYSRHMTVRTFPPSPNVLGGYDNEVCQANCRGVTSMMSVVGWCLLVGVSPSHLVFPPRARDGCRVVCRKQNFLQTRRLAVKRNVIAYRTLLPQKFNLVWYRVSFRNVCCEVSNNFSWLAGRRGGWEGKMTCDILLADMFLVLHIIDCHLLCLSQWKQTALIFCLICNANHFARI